MIEHMIKLSGLSESEVADRKKRGLANDTPNQSSRRVRDILRANILTYFNILIVSLAVIVWLVSRSPFNILFGMVVVINSLIGIVQELRAKRMLDKLAILNATQVSVIRDGKITSIAIADVVQDDLIKLKLGDQIVADGEILESSELEIDESLLTGESDPITKKASEKVLSGSIVVAGSGIMRATKVGIESHSYQLAIKAKKFQRAKSELLEGTNKLLKYISLMLIIVAPLIIFGQLRVDFGDWRGAIIHSAAAIVGMIPEGLVLLTSMAFMLAVMTLIRRKVLVQQMPAVETLARVDTLLLDKTGTITEGNIKFQAVVLSEEFHVSTEELHMVLATIASRAKSPTNNALRHALKKVKVAKFTREIPFSSARKYSAIEINNRKWLFGAPEIIFSDNQRSKMFKKAQEIANGGERVLALVQIKEWPDENDVKLPEPIPAALVVLSEKVRETAEQTLNYFTKQNVDIKIISGDSPLTVAAVARSVGLKTINVFDARQLPDPEKSEKDANKFAKIITAHNIFGRVQPEQKRQITTALQEQDRVVAMTGDGVNDALALKKADLGIAMNSGSAATKSVAEIVLLDNEFSHLPNVLGEGRRVIANIERVASLFVIKNVYTLVLALAVTIAGMTYPYLPSQMTVISMFSIGLPAFFLALAPNQQIYRKGFLRRVLKFAIPIGVLAAILMMVNYIMIVDYIGGDKTVAGTSVSIVLMMMMAAVLFVLSQPTKGWKIALIITCLAAFATIVIVPFFAARFEFMIRPEILPVTLIMGGAGMTAVFLVQKFVLKGKILR